MILLIFHKALFFTNTTFKEVQIFLLLKWNKKSVFSIIKILNCKRLNDSDNNWKFYKRNLLQSTKTDLLHGTNKLSFILVLNDNFM